MENRNIQKVTNIQDIISIENRIENRILSNQSIINDFNNFTCEYFAYYADNTPVGYISYCNCIDHIDIISIAVIPKYRRKKIATSLIKYLEEKNINNLSIFLEVRRSNLNAIYLYSSLGYKHISTRKNYYSYPVEDALIYKKG